MSYFKILIIPLSIVGFGSIYGQEFCKKDSKDDQGCEIGRPKLTRLMPKKVRCRSSIN